MTHPLFSQIYEQTTTTFSIIIPVCRHDGSRWRCDHDCQWHDDENV